MKKIQVSFQYCEDCPSHDVALERLRRVLEEENLQAIIEVTKVESNDQARSLHFVGSPTILLNGRDIDPPAGPQYYALACRAYRLEDGRISPLPSNEMIRKAVRAVKANLKS